MTQQPDSYDLLEQIRELQDGDHVTITHRRTAEHPKETEAVVTGSTGGEYPLVDLREPDEGPDDERYTFALEYDEHHSDGTPYNIRRFIEDYDGASVVDIEVSDR